MKKTFLKSSEDMRWLKEVHTELAEGHKCALIYGNEDFPSKVCLYRRDSYNCVPTVLEMDVDGKLKVVSVGE